MPRPDWDREAADAVGGQAVEVVVLAASSSVRPVSGCGSPPRPSMTRRTILVSFVTTSSRMRSRSMASPTEPTGGMPALRRNGRLVRHGGPTLRYKALLLVHQRRHAGQRLALQELQRRAAAGGDVGELVGEPSSCTSATVSPPPTIVVASSAASASAMPSEPWANARELGDAERAVPDDGLAVFDRLAEAVDGFGPMSRIRQSGGTSSTDTISESGVGGEAVGDDDVDGQEQRDAVLSSACCMMSRAVLELVVFDERLRRRRALRLEERGRHAAADQQAVDLRQQVAAGRRSWC